MQSRHSIVMSRTSLPRFVTSSLLRGTLLVELGLALAALLLGALLPRKVLNNGRAVGLVGGEFGLDLVLDGLDGELLLALGHC